MAAGLSKSSGRISPARSQDGKAGGRANVPSAPAGTAESAPGRGLLCTRLGTAGHLVLQGELDVRADARPTDVGVGESADGDVLYDEHGSGV